MNYFYRFNFDFFPNNKLCSRFSTGSSCTAVRPFLAPLWGLGHLLLLHGAAAAPATRHQPHGSQIPAFTYNWNKQMHVKDRIVTGPVCCLACLAHFSNECIVKSIRFQHCPEELTQAWVILRFRNVSSLCCHKRSHSSFKSSQFWCFQAGVEAVLECLR